MKIDLGIGALELPQGYAVQTFTAMGPTDAGAPIAAGMPTVSKTQSNEHARVIAVSARNLEGNTVTLDILKNALNGMKSQAKGALKNVNESPLNGLVCVYAELQHRMEKTPTVTFVMLVGAKDNLWSIMLTALDDKKALDAARTDFQNFTKTLALR